MSGEVEKSSLIVLPGKGGNSRLMPPKTEYPPQNDLVRGLIAQLVNNPPAIQETLVQFLGLEDLPKKGYATHTRILGLPLWLSW